MINGDGNVMIKLYKHSVYGLRCSIHSEMPGIPEIDILGISPGQARAQSDM